VIDIVGVKIEPFAAAGVRGRVTVDDPGAFNIPWSAIQRLPAQAKSRKHAVQ
jgi:hypothetical protein